LKRVNLIGQNVNNPISRFKKTQDSSVYGLATQESKDRYLARSNSIKELGTNNSTANINISS